MHYFTQQKSKGKAKGSGGKNPKDKPADDSDDEDEPLAEAKRTAIIRMVEEGAYRKATMAMLEQGEVVPGKEALGWAHRLHPESEDPSGPYTPSPATGPQVHSHGEEAAR